MGEDWNNILMYFFFNFILLALHSVSNVYVWWWIRLYEMYICLVLTNSCIRVLIATTSKSVCKNTTKKYLISKLTVTKASSLLAMYISFYSSNEWKFKNSLGVYDSNWFFQARIFIHCFISTADYMWSPFLFCRYKYIVILLPSINKFSLCVVYKFFIQFGK